VECGQLEGSLPAEVKQDFARIVGARGEEGLAEIEEEYCGNCNQMVNSQMINELLLEKVVTCKNCGAFLYLPENRELVKRGE
jgi:predicted  nucleic acid-binding Zn-ribbon protein